LKISDFLLLNLKIWIMKIKKIKDADEKFFRTIFKHFLKIMCFWHIFKLGTFFMNY
jgi:hypothetical protein